MIPQSIAAAMLLSAVPATAGTSVPSLTTPEPVAITAPAASSWEFRITPAYGWLTALDGTSGPDGSATDLDMSFTEILDVLKMYASLQMEARHGRWGFLADGFYACLGSSLTGTGPLREHVSVDLKQFLGEFEVLYRVCESPQHLVDVYAGLRYNSLDLDLALAGLINRSVSAKKEWADPIIGLRGQWNINNKWYLAGKGDIGGFGVSSDFTWNLQATVGYNFTESFSAELGYRYFDTDYDDGGFTYDMAARGVVINFNFMF